MKNFLSKIAFILCIGIALTSYSCTNNEILSSIPPSTNPDNLSKTQEISSLDFKELEDIKMKLEQSGIDVSNFKFDDSLVTEQQKIIPFLKAVKISTKTPHPDRLGSYIDVSGVLLLPSKTIFNSLTKYRIIVAPPPTYTYNKMAPSNAFKDSFLFDSDFHFNYLAFWTLQASNGFIVFFPDYPGFGDSYQQCQHPYLDSKAMVNSTLDLLKASLNTLSAQGYRYKSELIITGYSLGGFIAASLAREIETNPSLEYTVSLLVTGGTPCNLKQITDIVRKSKKTQHHYFLSYGLWGYKQNAYPYINVNDFLKESFASQSLSYFNGNIYDVNNLFPSNPEYLYTEKFIKNLDIDPSLSYLNTILEENSVKPWKNKCRFVMSHGISDVSVYYQNAYDFAQQQNKNGGKVTFYSTLGDHVLGIAPYYAKASLYTLLYK
ncbi:lipase family protein [Apibacter raozihei]|uniref:alpha/beta hydrolase family protein n=1 Tax=Apibacter raozihei TaxID=2500547 RepID=UPI000FE43DBD|nr:lipase family protein [Apibacter raozihei]